MSIDHLTHAGEIVNRLHVSRVDCFNVSKHNGVGTICFLQRLDPSLGVQRLVAAISNTGRGWQSSDDAATLYYPLITSRGEKRRDVWKV